MITRTGTALAVCTPLGNMLNKAQRGSSDGIVSFLLSANAPKEILWALGHYSASKQLEAAALSLARACTISAQVHSKEIHQEDRGMARRNLEVALCNWDAKCAVIAKDLCCLALKSARSYEALVALGSIYIDTSPINLIACISDKSNRDDASMFVQLVGQAVDAVHESQLIEESETLRRSSDLMIQSFQGILSSQSGSRPSEINPRDRVRHFDAAKMFELAMSKAIFRLCNLTALQSEECMYFELLKVQFIKIVTTCIFVQ
jgi:hypothetical protein